MTEGGIAKRDSPCDKHGDKPCNSPCDKHGEKTALVLASASKQRLCLLERLGVRPHRLQAVCIDERPLRQETPRLLVARLARSKADEAQRQLAEEGVLLSDGLCLLAADTAVVCARRILGKPRDREQAKEFLQKLSGRRHQVWTSIVVCDDRRSNLRWRLTRVAFKRLTEREIEKYVDSQEWRESAGGYRIQGEGEGFVRALNGSHSAVVGLPLFETRQLLLSYGVL